MVLYFDKNYFLLYYKYHLTIYHYNKHYKGYVEKLNLALDKKKFGDLDLEQIVKTISRFNKTVRDNAGGAYNHALFWKMLSPKKQAINGT